MPIKIERQGDLYTAEVTPPHGDGRRWASSRPMTTDELIEALQALGCHQTDIGDAFYEADPAWQLRSND